MKDKINIGITGASGLVGTYLSKSLSSNPLYSVKGLHVSGFVPDILKNEPITWEKGDIRDLETLEHFVEDLDIVIHTAAIVSFSKKDKEKLYDINVGGTRDLVNVLLGTGKKLIHISSISTLGRKDGDQMIDEDTFWNDNLPHSTYAHSKFLAEMEVFRGIAEGLDAMIFLPSIIMGESERDASSAALWKQVKNFPWVAPAGANGFVDVEDIVTYVKKAIENWKSGKKIILNGHNISYKEFYSIVLDNLDKENNIRTLSPNVLYVFRPFFNSLMFIVGKNSRITKENIETTSKAWSFSNSKSIELFGNQYTDLSKSIAKYVQK